MNDGQYGHMSAAIASWSSDLSSVSPLRNSSNYAVIEPRIALAFKNERQLQLFGLFLNDFQCGFNYLLRRSFALPITTRDQLVADRTENLVPFANAANQRRLDICTPISYVVRNETIFADSFTYQIYSDVLNYTFCFRFEYIDGRNHVFVIGRTGDHPLPNSFTVATLQSQTDYEPAPLPITKWPQLANPDYTELSQWTDWCLEYYPRYEVENVAPQFNNQPDYEITKLVDRLYLAINTSQTLKNNARVCSCSKFSKSLLDQIGRGLLAYRQEFFIYPNFDDITPSSFGAPFDTFTPGSIGELSSIDFLLARLGILNEDAASIMSSTFRFNNGCNCSKDYNYAPIFQGTKDFVDEDNITQTRDYFVVAFLSKNRTQRSYILIVDTNIENNFSKFIIYESTVTGNYIERVNTSLPILSGVYRPFELIEVDPNRFAKGPTFDEFGIPYPETEGNYWRPITRLDSRDRECTDSLFGPYFGTINACNAEGFCLECETPGLIWRNRRFILSYKAIQTTFEGRPIGVQVVDENDIVITTISLSQYPTDGEPEVYVFDGTINVLGRFRFRLFDVANDVVGCSGWIEVKEPNCYSVEVYASNDQDTMNLPLSNGLTLIMPFELEVVGESLEDDSLLEKTTRSNRISYLYRRFKYSYETNYMNKENMYYLSALMALDNTEMLFVQSGIELLATFDTPSISRAHQQYRLTGEYYDKNNVLINPSC